MTDILSQLDKDSIRLSKQNAFKLNLQRVSIIRARIKSMYFKGNFDIPRGCWDNPHTNINEALDVYMKRYDTDHMQTKVDTDLALARKTISKYAKKYPEYFI